MEVISYSLKGNSFPIVIKQGNTKLFVKLSAGLSGEYSMLSEWFGNSTGKLIGLNTRQPLWVLLTESLKYDHIYIEARDLIGKSLGINIGFEYIENIADINQDEMSENDKESMVEVYLLDLLMLNIDRTTQNHNLLKLDNDEILITDFDSSLLFNELLNASQPSSDKRVLQCLKSNPLYQRVKKDRLDNFIEKFNQINFRSIINDIPEEVLNASRKHKILTKLEDKKKREWDLREIIQNIEKISLESEEERDFRIKMNRQKLEKLVNATPNAHFSKKR